MRTSRWNCWPVIIKISTGGFPNIKSIITLSPVYFEKLSRSESYPGFPDMLDSGGSEDIFNKNNCFCIHHQFLLAVGRDYYEAYRAVIRMDRRYREALFKALTTSKEEKMIDQITNGQITNGQIFRKIVCVCDFLVDQAQQQEYKGLEQFGVNVTLIDNDDLINDKDSCMEVMLKAEEQGADAVICNEKVVAALKDADIAIVHITPINKSVIDQCGNLKVLGVMRGGLNSVDVEYLKKKGITVVHAPLRSAHAVADFTVGIMLSEMNNIAKSYHGIMEGKWIKGYANGDNVHDPFVSDGDIKKMGFMPVSKQELLRQADIISIHLRLSDTTRNYIGENEFSKMKTNCIRVNTARAGLVEHSAYIELDNITMTAHIAGTSCDTFINSVDFIYEEMERYLNGKEMGIKINAHILLLWWGMIKYV